MTGSANLMLRPSSRLVLGTVQLGMSYGIANISGQPSLERAVAMVAEAWGRGVRVFDTAQSYGQSEDVLGRVFATLGIGREATVLSKFAGSSDADLKSVLQSIENSLCRLGIPRLGGMFLHREEDLDGSLPAILSEARRAGLVEHVGASVYSAERALQAVEMEGVEIVQVAANVFDRRMERAGVFARAARLGKTVFVRSIYLQGLVLMSGKQLLPNIPMAGEAIRKYYDFCIDRRLDSREFAIDHVRHMAPSAMLVIGAETVEQVRNNCDLIEAPPYGDELHRAWTLAWPDDWVDLIDPRKWKTPAAEAGHR